MRRVDRRTLLAPVLLQPRALRASASARVLDVHEKTVFPNERFFGFFFHFSFF